MSSVEPEVVPTHSVPIDIAAHFPFASLRPGQEDAVRFALDAILASNKRFVILELGTGCGKSPIGLAIARCLSAAESPPDGFKKGAYLITTQKILQDQYERDFGKTSRSIKSSSNYTCKYYKTNTCAESRTLLKSEPKGTPFFKSCVFDCVYKNAKKAFLESEESITNFPYFMIEANYQGEIEPRHVLIVDEAHNTDLELGKFVEVVITQRFADKVLHLPAPKVTTDHQLISWIQDVYYPKLSSHVRHVDSLLERYHGVAEKVKEFLKLQRQIDTLKSHLSKIEKFIEIYDPDNWVVNWEAGDGGKRWEFKAIDMSRYAHQYLFRLGHRVVLMSATILNHEGFCQSLGIPTEEAAFLSVPTPFPVENRPIVYSPVGRMTKDDLDRTLPNLVTAIKTILDHHKGEKGIIHAHTFKIANYIAKNVRSKRILVHDSTNRSTVLEQHVNSKEPTVIVSPSMTEGVDLKEDISRFQIVCKIPYPYLGDKLCRKRMNKWPWWYTMQTAKTMLQSVGRSVRSMEDHAVTYILDEDWEIFFRRNRHLFPQTFIESLK